jgi:hypothetical protein
MKRMRLRTGMVLIAVAALCFALASQWIQNLQRQRQLEAEAEVQRAIAEQETAKLRALMLQQQAK